MNANITEYHLSISQIFSNNLIVNYLFLFQGDSGGGVIYKDRIYGVISGSKDPCFGGLAVTVNVCPYMDWINQKIAQSNGK